MLKSFIICTLILFSNITAWCQLQLNAYAGISPGNQAGSRSILVNRESPGDEFQFALVQSKPKVFGGIKGNVSLKDHFFVETGLLYGHSESVFQTEYTVANRSDEVVPDLLHQTKHQLVLPVNIGVNLGAMEITSGMRVSKTITETNEFNLIKGFTDGCDGVSMGWQSGVRYALGGVLIGIEYMAEMERVGEGLSVNSSSLALHHVPGNFVFSLQYRM